MQFADKEVVTALVAHTFKGLTVENAKKAALEGMLRGFGFKDFLEKNVYAIPYGTNYSLVTSIDYARKIGMRSGVIGKGAPKYEVSKDGKIVACTVSVLRQVGENKGEFTETVYFDEYTTGKNLWLSKPRTMIAKVAEMHALRMACPEELSQAYVEEEVERETKPKLVVNINEYAEKLEVATNLQELMVAWASMPVEAKTALEGRKNELKAKFAAHADA